MTLAMPEVLIPSNRYHRKSLYPTREMRATRYRQIDRLRRKHELSFTRAAYRFLRAQIKIVATHLDGHRSIQQRAIEGSGFVDNLFDAEDMDEKLINTFRPFQVEIVLEFGQDAIDELKAAGFRFDIDRPDIQNFIANDLAERSRLINKTSARRIQSLINAGVDQGLGVPQIADKLRESGDVLSRFRANLIARTETGRAQGIATYAGFEQGEAAAREWLTARDPFVRGSDPKDPYENWHTSMDGQVAAMGEEFVGNGGQLNLYVPPTSGDAGYCVNCRCAAAPIAR